MRAVGQAIYNDRTYRLVEHGHFEYSTNCWVSQSDVTVTDEETGEELDTIELDSPIRDQSGIGLLTFFEFLCDAAKWELQYD